MRQHGDAVVGRWSVVLTLLARNCIRCAAPAGAAPGAASLCCIPCTPAAPRGHGACASRALPTGRAATVVAVPRLCAAVVSASGSCWRSASSPCPSGCPVPLLARTPPSWYSIPRRSGLLADRAGSPHSSALRPGRLGFSSRRITVCCAARAQGIGVPCLLVPPGRRDAALGRAAMGGSLPFAPVCRLDVPGVPRRGSCLYGGRAIGGKACWRALPGSLFVSKAGGGGAGGR